MYEKLLVLRVLVPLIAWLPKNRVLNLVCRVQGEEQGPHPKLQYENPALMVYGCWGCQGLNPELQLTVWSVTSASWDTRSDVTHGALWHLRRHLC